MKTKEELKQFALEVLANCKESLEKEGEEPPQTAYLFTEDGKTIAVVCPWKDRHDRSRILSTLMLMTVAHFVTSYVFVSAAWIGGDVRDASGNRVEPRHQENRRQAFIAGIRSYDYSGFCQVEFDHKFDGTIEFKDAIWMEEEDAKGDLLEILPPFRLSEVSDEVRGIIMSKAKMLLNMTGDVHEINDV